MGPLTTSESERETAVLIRSLLLSTGRKCRLCEVIVQAVADGKGGGGVDLGMQVHRQVVHRISQ